MILPSSVPCLPVLDWKDFGLPGTVPSVIDGSEYFFTTSGRAAIMLGLEALGICEGHRVLVPTYHCPTMVAPIIALGAVPVFYPITENGEADLRSWAAEDMSTVKAAIVPHYFGIPRPMSDIRSFCDLHEVALIEDCAHCFFGKSGARIVGHWGDIAIASLTKFFPVPSGGILAFPQGGGARPRLESPGIVRELKAWVDILETAVSAGRLSGVRPVLRRLFSLKRALRYGSFSPEAISPASDVMAPEALTFDVALAHQAPERATTLLPRISNTGRIASRRRTNYLRLLDSLSGHHGFSPLCPDLPEGAVPYVFPIRVRNPDPKYRQLKASGLPVFRWNWLWPGTPVIEGDVGLQWASEVFQLACHQNLSEEELECICHTVIQVCRDPPLTTT